MTAACSTRLRSLPMFLRLCGLLCLIVIPQSMAMADTKSQLHAFEVGTLFPGNQEPITDAVLLVQDGKVIAAGNRDQVKIPARAVRHDLSGSVVVPGFVIADSSIGVSGDDERTLTPEVRAIDGFDVFADYSPYIAAGVTTVQISPGRQRLMPGQGAVVKLAGADPTKRILSNEESLRLILSRESAGAPRIYEPPVGAVSVDNPLDPTRPQVAESLAARLAALRAIFQAAIDGAVDEEGVVDFESLRASVERGRFRVKANSDAEVRAALGLLLEVQELAGKKFDVVLTEPQRLESCLLYTSPSPRDS